ncbi:unnamed protein product [Anisakis simplex]|uniref:Sushi domain-containing protein n=1 Tax=Anisakis simplex TaxID=6269 RepID=A0A0M3J3L9_ANISI|nr:unnamed protein product [Anisakis simplex]
MQMKTDRISVVCYGDGEWREKRTNLIIRDINSVECVPSTPSVHPEHYSGDHLCKEPNLRSDDRKSVMTTSKCKPNIRAGCKYFVKCNSGLIINIVEEESSSLTVACGADGKWLEKRTKNKFDEIYSLECVSSRMFISHLLFHTHLSQSIMQFKFNQISKMYSCELFDVKCTKILIGSQSSQIRLSFANSP